MRSLFLAACLLELVGTAASLFWLPERVGDPGKTMDRGAFVLLMLVLSVAVPWQCVNGAAWIARRFPSALNLPNKAYWLAPERREASLARLHEAMTLLGLLLVVHFGGLQLFILQRSGVPGLAWTQEVWLAGAGMLALAFVAWIIQLHRRFAMPPAARADAQVSRHPRRPERRPGA